MAKVTEKLQITLPKAVATALGIGPGTELTVEAAGGVLLLRPVQRSQAPRDVEQLLRDFDHDTEIQRQRDAHLRATAPEMFTQPVERGWRREDLYGDRGLPR